MAVPSYGLPIREAAMVFEGIRSAMDNRKAHKEWLARYDEALGLLTGARTEPEWNVARQEIDEAVSQGQLAVGDLREPQRRAMLAMAERMFADDRISIEEYQHLSECSRTLGAIRLADWGIDEDRVGRCYYLSEIDSGRLPEVPRPAGVVFHEGEVVHWGGQATLHKRKVVKTGLHYAGLTKSIKIAKGLRFRVGSFQIARTGSVHLVREDAGSLMLTNQRVLFMGGVKRFDMTLGQITSLVMGDAGIEISKKGRAAPFIFGMDRVEDYEIPVALLGALSA